MHRLGNSNDEHAAIVAAIVAGDAEKAYVAMRDHANRLSIHVLDVLRERQAGHAA